MRTPVIIINFKVYTDSIGARAVKLAQICEEVGSMSGASIALAPALPDLARIAQIVKIPVLAQHFDPVKPGSRTGWTPLEAVKSAGAVGSILNHSERKIQFNDLKVAIEQCAGAGMTSVVCADTIEEVKKVAEYRPDYIAIEPPELIGGDISVTSARPEIVTKAVDSVHMIDSDIRVLCGAGVKTGQDVRKAIELGTVGVLLASGVVKARDPRNAMLDLVKGLT